MRVEVLLELALEAEYLAANLARVLVVEEHLVHRRHVPGLVLGDCAAEVAAPVLLRPLLVSDGCNSGLQCVKLYSVILSAVTLSSGELPEYICFDVKNNWLST